MEEELLIKKISFNKRPIPLPAEYRPMYKIALIVIILKYCCRGETSNLLKLHLFSWALTSEKNMNELRYYVTSNFQTGFSVWGIEPALNRALQLAVAENICDIVNGKNYKLTKKGNLFFEMIVADKELFEIERNFLSIIGKNQITDNRIIAMTQKWNLFDVEN
jgi:hypothetical protein